MKYYSTSKIQNPKSKRGFTLVESLIYAVLVVLIGAASITFILAVIQNKTKSEARYSVSEDARLALGRMVQEIHAAQDINTGSSDFDINLADPANAGKKLSLSMRDVSVDPVEFDVSNYVLRIKEGASGPYALTSDEMKVTNLTFTNLTSPNSQSKNINIELIVEHPNPENQQVFDASITLKTTVELKDRDL